MLHVAYSCYTRDNSISGVNFKAKEEADRTTRCGDMVIWNFPNQRSVGRQYTQAYLYWSHIFLFP